MVELASLWLNRNTQKGHSILGSLWPDQTASSCSPPFIPQASSDPISSYSRSFCRAMLPIEDCIQCGETRNIWQILPDRNWTSIGKLRSNLNFDLSWMSHENARPLLSTPNYLSTGEFALNESDLGLGLECCSFNLDSFIYKYCLVIRRALLLT